MADKNNPFAGMTDEQLDALIAQGQVPPSSSIIVPGNNTMSEMKGLTKAGGVGLIKRVTDDAGLPGDVQGLVTAGLNQFMPQPSDQGQTRAPSSFENMVNAVRGAAELPTSQGIQKGIERLTGPFYQPQTGAEKVAQAGGEAVPFGILGTEAPLANMAGAGWSGAASEAAGQATEGTPYETLARGWTGMGAYGFGTAVPPTTKIVANTPVRAAAQTLENAGVRVPASAISGNRLTATLEGGPSDIKAAAGPTLQKQSGVVRPPGNTDQFSQLLAQRGRDVAAQADQLGASTSIPAPAIPPLRSQLAASVANHVGHYGGTSLERPEVTQGLQDFDQLTTGGVPLTGTQYQGLHQQWNGSGVPELRTMAKNLDAAMDKAHPGAWDEWRDNHANLVGARASSEPMGGAATVSPMDPDKIVGAMYRRTPMRDTAEAAQTVHAAQPKPYDPSSVLGGLGALAGLGAGTAYHGGMVGTNDAILGGVFG